jgi:hypothetical protein
MYFQCQNYRKAALSKDPWKSQIRIALPFTSSLFQGELMEPNHSNACINFLLHKEKNVPSSLEEQKNHIQIQKAINRKIDELIENKTSIKLVEIRKELENAKIAPVGLFPDDEHIRFQMKKKKKEIGAGKIEALKEKLLTEEGCQFLRTFSVF